MPARLASMLAQFPALPDPGEGSEGFQRMMSIFGTLMLIGFVLGIAGHITKIKTLVLVGVVLVFAATALFLVGVAQYG